MKHLAWLWTLIGIVGAGALVYASLSKSKRRYLGYILKQAPSLLSRYYA